MTSEFDQLAEKIRQLADLAQKLRRENADLRLQIAALSSENIQISERMHEAKQRVSALLDSIPAVHEAELGE